MSKRSRNSNSCALLDLWRPPEEAGQPIGCLATTYTFDPGLFDEQCLARFLDIDSEPNRESLAFLLEREDRLGAAYAGVLVDHLHGGVPHSLRWDVLPVRVWGAKQHSKVSLLAWSHHVRVLVASANLTLAGYRTNREVAAAVELCPEECDYDTFAETVAFLRDLLVLVPGSSQGAPEVRRAEAFLRQVERLVQGWNSHRRGKRIRQHLVCTFPSRPGSVLRSSLEEAISICRERGGSPDMVRIASPFYDPDATTSETAAAICKLLARNKKRHVSFCVPSTPTEGTKSVPRLAAPKSIFTTTCANDVCTHIEVLPDKDEDRNTRPWHAKMASFDAPAYSAVMIGSSNCTCAGMGVGKRRNIEANLLTIVGYEPKSRYIRELERLWPAMEEISDPDRAEWLGCSPQPEEEAAAGVPVPAGFVSATYRAGDEPSIVLQLDPLRLPEHWTICACGHKQQQLLRSSSWKMGGEHAVVQLAWESPEPPEQLLVEWAQHKAFLTLNVEDSSKLPPPSQLEHMSAEEMLNILAATDPSAAYRAWAARTKHDDGEDSLDSAAPVDLDPLRRYDLQSTFLHRIRRRARILAQLKSNLERPVWARQALEWRLRGLVGVEQLANRMLQDFCRADGAAGEALLSLADFLIVLREVKYQAADGSLSKAQFDTLFHPFVKDLATTLSRGVEGNGHDVSEDVLHFWGRVVDKCQS